MDTGRLFSGRRDPERRLRAVDALEASLKAIARSQLNAIAYLDAKGARRRAEEERGNCNVEKSRCDTAKSVEPPLFTEVSIPEYSRVLEKSTHSQIKLPSGREPMNWRDTVRDKLMTPDEAVAVVRPEHRVWVAPFTCTPFTLCQALYRRRHELRGMRLDHPAGLFPWAQPGEEPAFEVHTVYATPADRDLVNQGLVEYLPVATWQGDPLPWGLIQEPDVYLVPISPPDRNGYCSFGPGVWFSRTLCQRSKLVIAEVHENLLHPHWRRELRSRLSDRPHV